MPGVGSTYFFEMAASISRSLDCRTRDLLNLNAFSPDAPYLLQLLLYTFRFGLELRAHVWRQLRVLLQQAPNVAQPRFRCHFLWHEMSGYG
jgi:hypothetical protein